MNKSLKGKQTEVWLSKTFVNFDIWSEYYLAPRLPFADNRDIANLFDGLAISKNYDYIELYQVKYSDDSNESNYYKAKGKVKEFFDKWKGGNSVIFSVYLTNKKYIRIFRCTKFSVVDEKFILREAIKYLQR